MSLKASVTSLNTHTHTHTHAHTHAHTDAGSVSNRTLVPLSPSVEPELSVLLTECALPGRQTAARARALTFSGETQKRPFGKERRGGR